MSTDKNIPVDPTLSNKKIRAHIESDLPPDADAEEIFNNFWKKNGPSIFSTIAVCLAIILGVQTYHYVKDQNRIKKEAAFAECSTPEQFRAFAEAHEGDALAGAALLNVAADLYAQGNYSEAAELYSKASASLGGTLLYERSLLGNAMALLLGDQAEQGVSMLQALANNTGVLDTTRAEAGYNLAVYYWQQRDFIAMRATIESILVLENPGLNGMRAQRLLETVPELNAESAAAQPSA